MTGEITLRGRVLPVGGVREKVLAAHRSGLKKVLIPTKNEKDLIEVPQLIRDQLEIVLVDHMDTVLENSIVGELKYQNGLRPSKRQSRKPGKKSETVEAD
mgnify:FL=1